MVEFICCICWSSSVGAHLGVFVMVEFICCICWCSSVGAHLRLVEPIRNFFAALFLANIGMLIDVHFLWNHIDILLAAVILVIVIKTLVVATVVKGFRYNNKTSLLVGMSLAQIGEFAFVLLSLASNVHLVEGKLYLLLLDTTALSLAMFIPSAEALDTSYFMSNYVWNPDDGNVGGGSDFDDMTETCSIYCSSGSCYTQDED